MTRLIHRFPKLRASLLEIPIFFILLELFDAYLQTLQLSLQEIKPHIYWIAILTFGSVYGLPISLLMGILTALLSISWENLGHAYALSLAAELAIPLLFLLEGGIVGILSQRRQMILDERKNMSQELANQLTTLEADRQRLIEANLALEKKAVTREDTVLTLYESAQKLSSLQADEIFKNVPNLLIEYLHAEACSVYVHENHQLVMIAQLHWQNETEYPSIYDHRHPLYKLLQQKRRLLTERELEGIDEAILIAPLLTREQRLYGMLKIERMAFMNLYPASLQIFQMLSDWTMQALENAQSFGMSKQSQLMDQNTGAYTFFYFQERLKREIRLARRYHLDLSVLYVAITNFSRMEPEVQQTVLRIVYRVMEFQFRGDDLITRTSEGQQYQFYIIMPFTNREGAKVAIQRCLQDIEGYEFKPFQDNEDEILLLTWEILETQDQSLFTDEIVLEIVADDSHDRTSEMVEKLLNS